MWKDREVYEELCRRWAEIVASISAQYSFLTPNFATAVTRAWNAEQNQVSFWLVEQAVNNLRCDIHMTRHY